MYKAFKNLDTSTEDTLQNTLQTIKNIEESPATGSEDAHFPMALQKQRHHTYQAPPHGSATNARHPTRHLTTILLAPEAFLESVSFNTVCSSQYSNLLFMGLRGPRNPIHSTQCVHSLNCMVQYTVVSLCVVPS